MYHFIKSIRSNEMVKFKDSFRTSDLFIIDDIQFVIGKEAMQEEFFHTFNALIDKGSQIVISSDRAPIKLTKIQERIKSRFSGGLVVDIQQSDFDLRLTAFFISSKEGLTLVFFILSFKKLYNLLCFFVSIFLIIGTKVVHFKQELSFIIT